MNSQGQIQVSFCADGTNEASECDEVSARWGGRQWQLRLALKVWDATQGEENESWAIQKDLENEKGRVYLYLRQDVGRE